MKAWFLLLPMLFVGCASGGKQEIKAVPDKPAAPDTSHVMAVFGRYATAHACPISANRVLTNAHVMDPEVELPFQPQRWSDEDGESGWLEPDATVEAADLAVMVPDHPLVHWYQLAESAPVEGQRLWLVNYSWDGQDEAYEPEVVETRVIRVVAGSVIYKPAGKQGSSGSCVLDSEGKIVAINAWGKKVGPMNMKEVGIGVGVYPPWLPMSILKHKEPE